MSARPKGAVVPATSKIRVLGAGAWVRPALRGHRVLLGAGALAGLALATLGLEPWPQTVLRAAAVTAVAVLAGPLGPPRHAWVRWPAWMAALSKLAAPALLLGLEGAVAVARGAAPGPLAASAGALLAWALFLLALSELGVRRFGEGALAFGLTALPAALLLGAPVTLNPLFPWATRPALVLCPLVAAARAQRLDVIHQPVLYQLSALDALEFHYPPWYLHPIFVLSFAIGLLALAAVTQEPQR